MKLKLLLLTFAVAACDASSSQVVEVDSTEAIDELAYAVVPSTSNVVYCIAGSDTLKMDIYQAGAAFVRPRPVVIGVHGGAWLGGGKTSDVLMYDAARWPKKGLTVISINYRVGPRIFPAYMEDTACAVQHVKDNAALYGIDSTKVALWGHSAGGHIALHTAYSRPGFVRGVLSYAAPIDPIHLQDFEPDIQTDIQNVFGPDSIKWLASVSPLIGSSSPTLLFHGTLDASIGMAQPGRLVGGIPQVLCNPKPDTITSGNRTLHVICRGGHYLTRPSAFPDSVAVPSRLTVSNQGATFLLQVTSNP